jgi:hypothetical protein
MAPDRHSINGIKIDQYQRRAADAGRTSGRYLCGFYAAAIFSDRSFTGFGAIQCVATMRRPARARRRERGTMFDIGMLLAGTIAFALFLGYVALCDRM